MKLHVLFLGFLAFCLSGNLSAQSVPYNQTFPVTTEIHPHQYGVYQIKGLTDGGLVACWESYQDNWGVYIQLFNSDFSKRGNTFRVKTKNTDSQWDPDVAVLKNVGFVVCWSSFDSEGWSSDVYAQIYDNFGTEQSEDFLVNTYTAWAQQEPAVTGLSGGGFAVCWYGGNDVMCQIFNQDGSKNGEEFMASKKGSVVYGRYSPKIAGLSDNGFVICWESSQQDGGALGIYAQVFNSDGSKRGDEIQVNQYTPDNQGSPSIAVLRNDNFVICWESYFQDGSWHGIYGREYDINGNPRGDEFRVNRYIQSDQRYPSVSELGNGGYAICWESSGQKSPDTGIYCQVFHADGSRRFCEFEVINDYGNQGVPKVANIFNKSFLVTWKQNSTAVYGKYYHNQFEQDLQFEQTIQDFALLEPISDLTIQTNVQTLKWTNAGSLKYNLPWGVEYKIYLDQNFDFADPEIITSIYDTTYTLQNLIPGTTYFWKVLAKNIAGDSLWSSETNLFYVSENATSIEHPVSSNPERFELYANFPNPFNPETSISYYLPQGKAPYPVKVKIYDTLGRLVIALLDENQHSGYHSLKWDGKNSSDTTMPSGVYYCLVQAGENKAVQKMLLVR